MKWALIVLMLAVLTTSCVKVHDPYGDVLEVVQGDSGLMAVGPAVTETVERILKAKVKGSIYESGEIVSVFGTCLDAYDAPFLNASNESIINATFSAWYPNGTQFIFETDVVELTSPGHYLYTAPMAAVEGTYLTRLKCSLDDQFAYAWGEWQNPRWVGKINETINQINETQVLINQTYTNLSNQITIVGDIANNTVDRNDSLLYQLLWNITQNGVPTTGLTGAINFTEEFTNPVFHGLWEINATVLKGGTQVGSDYVNCYINTTNANPTNNAQMEPITGPKFHYEEIVKKRFDFDWDIWCVDVV